MRNPSIGLICKSHNYETINGSTMTGNWVISPKKIETLVGKDVILTESSSKPAYKGGKITGYNRLENGKYALFFKEDDAYSGYAGHLSEWSPATNPVRYL